MIIRTGYVGVLIYVGSNSFVSMKRVCREIYGPSSHGDVEANCYKIKKNANERAVTKVSRAGLNSHFFRKRRDSKSE